MAERSNDESCGVALASLPNMGPGRLTALTRAYGFCGAWSLVSTGLPLDDPVVVRSLGSKPTEVTSQWKAAARRIDPSALRAAHAAAGIDVAILGSDRYPASLAADIEPPAVLFSRGDLDAVSGARVAIIGTRRCTRAGRLTAVEMGEQLADAGVIVVSGLALGIDGGAHEGALRSAAGTPVVGVVGTGLDVVYPRRHETLWHAVANGGVLLSEVPMGGGALPWRFPARNRIIAAISDLVVVVESHASGGALHTVEEAIRRDRAIFAVPGSVRSPASEGTNAMLFDGMGPVRNAADVLLALGFTGVLPAPSTTAADDLSELSPGARSVLDAVEGEPVSIDRLAGRAGRTLGQLAVDLIELEQRGLIVRTGNWIERT